TVLEVSTAEVQHQSEIVQLGLLRESRAPIPGAVLALDRAAVAARPTRTRIVPATERTRQRRKVALEFIGFNSLHEAALYMVDDTSFRKWLIDYHSRDRMATRPFQSGDSLDRYAEYVALRDGGVRLLRGLYLATGSNEA